MSVYKSKRSISKMEFIKTAQQISTYTIKQLKKFPKSYRFNIVNDLYRLSLEIYENSLKANSIYMNKNMTETEYLLRKKYLFKSKSAIFAMSGLLTIVFDMVIQGNNFLGDKEKTSNMFQEWARLLNLEHRLIKGVIDSDKKKWKEYQSKSKKSEQSKMEGENKNTDILILEDFNLD